MCSRGQYPNTPASLEWVLKCIGRGGRPSGRRRLLLRSSHRGNGLAEFAAKCIRDPMALGVEGVNDGKR
jgi:hypothetical protein